MIDNYIKLEHTKAEHLDWYVVNWCLGNTCNFSCSYCPEGLHDGSKRWPELGAVKNFVSKVVEQAAPRKVYFEFTGGEVTLYKHFTELCEFVTSLGAKVGLISNGSRTIKWWESHKQYFDHVCLSFHPEFGDADHYLEVVKLLHNDIRTHVNIMMSPEKFDYCLRVAEKTVELGNISFAMQPLIHDFGSILYDYTPEQKHIIDRQWHLYGKNIKFDRSFEFYRGAMVKVYADGRKTNAAPHVLINDKANNWAGWKCYAGVEQLIVDMDGFFYRGWCKVGGWLGRIDDPNLEIPKDPIICDKTMCHCNFDIMSTKEKV